MFAIGTVCVCLCSRWYSGTVCVCVDDDNWYTVHVSLYGCWYSGRVCVCVCSG